MSLPPLYKYLSIHGAELTLGGRAFKHAKPSDFNDTEDLTINGIFPEEISVATKKIEHDFIDVLLRHIDEKPTCGPPMEAQLLLIQMALRTRPDTANLIKAELAKQPVFNVDRMRNTAESLLKEINRQMQLARVLCVTTNNDSAEMWSEYAENHGGIALRIEPQRADSKFNRFRPVMYKDKRPTLYDTTNDYISSLFGDPQARLLAMMDKIVYSKTLKWQHESEYRLVIHLRSGESWNTDVFHPDEITELYLGYKIQESNAAKIVALARGINPNISIFKMKIGQNCKLGFDKI